LTTSETPGRGKIRLDQWLWFARLSKSRSLANRLCAAGAVTLNGTTVTKANQAARVGDVVTLPQGHWQRTVRIAALGARRGPAAQARLLYEELAPAMRLGDLRPEWVPLLNGDDAIDVQPAKPLL
jgi:ribosome-associated heat shock protein Hsp15